MRSVELSTTTLFACALAATGCAVATQRPAATPAQPRDFDDSAVSARCDCQPPRWLDDTSRIGDQLVSELLAAWSREVHTSVDWHPQQYFDVPSEPAKLAITLRPMQAYETTCSADSAELGCFSGTSLRGQLVLQSGDRVLDETLEIELRLTTAPVVHREVSVPDGLSTRRKQGGGTLMLALVFDEDPYGQLYVLQPTAPGEFEEHVVAKFKLSPVADPPASSQPPSAPRPL
jgi:hypothetical protein